MNERPTPSTDDVLSSLVRAAQQPATPEEVAAVPSLVDRFTVQATAAPTATAPGRSIDLSRVSRRTVSAVAAALLVAGTAAAAAGTGVLPGPLDFGSNEVTVTEDTTETTIPTEDTTEDTTETTIPTEDTIVDDSLPTEDTVVEVLPGDEYMAMLPEAHGLCTAWNNGGPKKMNPAFQKLQDAADEAGVSLEEFCTEVELAKDAHSDDDDDATESTDVPETEDPADDSDETDDTVSTDEADAEKGDNPSVTAPGRTR